MSNITQPRLHHLAITVTDLDASVRWYESVFDVHPILDIRHLGGVGRILAGTDRQLMIALHRHDANDGGLFTETATGLDHGGFAVPTYDDPCSAPATRSEPGRRHPTTIERLCYAARPSCWWRTKMSSRTGWCGRRVFRAISRAR